MPDLSVFISHTHPDAKLADALRDAIQILFGDQVKVEYSTNKELTGGPRPGEDWPRWIAERVKEARVALVLLTTASVQKPWVLWEAGAVAGAALAAGTAGKVRPLVYQIAGEQVP